MRLAWFASSSPRPYDLLTRPWPSSDRECFRETRSKDDRISHVPVILALRDTEAGGLLVQDSLGDLVRQQDPVSKQNQNQK